MPTRQPNLKAVEGREVVVGVSGGIAAYKTADLVSRIVQAGAAVTVVMTEAATRFVGPLTFQTLSARPVYTSLWESPEGFRSEHVALADRADLVVVAPATADCLGKLAHGLADDLLSTFLLAIDVPLLLAPAMNARMWAHPAVAANLKTLRSRGVRILGPDEGRLACGAVGKGRMAEPPAILAEIAAMLQHAPKRP